MIPNTEIFQVIKMDRVLTNTDCDAILELAGAQDFKEGEVASGAGTYQDPKYRKSSFTLLEQCDETGWIYKRVQQLVLEANKLYGFDLQGQECLQVAAYHPGEYYRPHMDLGPGHAKFRKLSIVVQLSDPKDYSGGGLSCLQPEATCPMERGSLIIFPSYVMHQVATVTRGVRYSLSTWFTGDRFH